MQIINFMSSKTWLSKESKSQPVPSSKIMPKWYKKADRFMKMPNGEYMIAQNKGKVPGWKSCPAILDIFTTGYTFITPCDIEFFINDFGKIDFKVEDRLYKEIITARPAMEEFHHPEGYYQDHFAWFPDWGVRVPDGYSVLYVSPLNRYDLPFTTVAGIIDNDKINSPGSMPFFIRDGWTGVLKAGTPYAQLLPFLREDWKSENIINTTQEIINNGMENAKKYRLLPNGGVYQKDVWTKRLYK